MHFGSMESKLSHYKSGSGMVEVVWNIQCFCFSQHSLEKMYLHTYILNIIIIIVFISIV